MRATVFVLIWVAGVVCGGEPVLIEFETFQKEFETEPLTDHHAFTERAKAYFTQISWIEAKKFSSPKEKAALQKMKSTEGLKWLIERIHARLAQIKANPGDATLQLADAGDLEFCVLQARNRIDPKNNPLPAPPPPVCPKLRLDPRSKAKLVTNNDWNRVTMLVERHIKHLEGKKYENVFSWDYVKPPKDKEAEIKRLEAAVASGELEIFRAFLQCRENTFIIYRNVLVVAYVPSKGEHYELILGASKERGEYGIERYANSLKTANQYGVFLTEEPKKK